MAVPAVGHLSLIAEHRGLLITDHRAVRRGQVVAVLGVGAEGLPRRLHRCAAPVRRTTATAASRGCSGCWSRSISSSSMAGIQRPLTAAGLVPQPTEHEIGGRCWSAATRAARRDLMEIVEERHGRASTLITRARRRRRARRDLPGRGAERAVSGRCILPICGPRNFPGFDGRADPWLTPGHAPGGQPARIARRCFSPWREGAAR